MASPPGVGPAPDKLVKALDPRLERSPRARGRCAAGEARPPAFAPASYRRADTGSRNRFSAAPRRGRASPHSIDSHRHMPAPVYFSSSGGAPLAPGYFSARFPAARTRARERWRPACRRPDRGFAALLGTRRLDSGRRKRTSASQAASSSASHNHVASEPSIIGGAADPLMQSRR